MEISDMPVIETPDAAQSEQTSVRQLGDAKLDRIAFELWQRGSLPEVAEADAAELEEVAIHASCL